MSKNSFFPIIGVEVHIELRTESKMFCVCPSSHFGKEPNTQVCPVCLGLPGALPYPNQKAIQSTILTGLALNCQINSLSKFDRKNYFYPDLPKGYQISQYDAPLAQNGKWKMENGKWIRIRRVHLEEDTGKLVHEEGTSLIDFNRSGVPLMEIVTEPDLNSAVQTKDFLQSLQQLVRYLGVAEADMEKGQMRCEPTVNLVLEREGRKIYTPLVELKNINSFRFVQKAIEFEIHRQVAELEKTGEEKSLGNKTTRGWSEERNETVLQREKEEAEDYRYFPEPDIPPLRLSGSLITSLKSQISELPAEKRRRFVKEYGLAQSAAEILTESRQLADYYEQAVKKAKSAGISAQEIANLLINKRIKVDEKVAVDEFIKLVLKSKTKPEFSEEEVEKFITEAIEKNPSAVADFKKGKTSALEFLVGQVARLSQGKADPNKTRELLKNRLSAS